MVASVLYTDSQYESGVTEIVYCVSQALEHLDRSKHVIVLSNNNTVKK